MKLVTYKVVIATQDKHCTPADQIMQDVFHELNVEGIVVEANWIKKDEETIDIKDPYGTGYKLRSNDFYKERSISEAFAWTTEAKRLIVERLEEN